MPKVSSAKVAWREQEVEESLQPLSLQIPPPSRPFSPHSCPPLGTFNGIKLWAWKSDNNCLGLKHNTLTGLTWPFSPPPLASRRGHLLLLLQSQPWWQAIVVRRHFLCHYPLTCWLPSHWHAEKEISRSMKVFRQKSLLIVSLMWPNQADVNIGNHQLVSVQMLDGCGLWREKTIPTQGVREVILQGFLV